MSHATLTALAAALIVAVGGCRPPAPSPAIPPPDPVSLRDRFPATATAVLAGRGTLRLEIEGRRMPALSVQLAVRHRGGGSLMLRPGALAPVLTLWAGEQAWSLRLPRERVAFEAAAAEEGGAEAAALLTAWMLTRVGWYVVSPATLVGDLVDAQTVAQGQAWILRGRVGDAPRGVRSAEVWIDPASGGIALWAIHDEQGRSLLRVAYDPPLESGRDPSRISFSVESLQARGDLVLRTLGPAGAPSATRPPLPDGWRLLPADELPDYIGSLAGPDE
jgi:hypothetical protein